MHESVLNIRYFGSILYFENKLYFGITSYFYSVWIPSIGPRSDRRKALAEAGLRSRRKPRERGEAETRRKLS